jgi:hypothetical protein
MRITDCGFIESENLAVLQFLSHKTFHLPSIRNPQSAIRNPQSAIERSSIFFINQVFLFAVVPTRPEQAHMMRVLV